MSYNITLISMSNLLVMIIGAVTGNFWFLGRLRNCFAPFKVWWSGRNSAGVGRPKPKMRWWQWIVARWFLTVGTALPSTTTRYVT